jgi:hypothetical protein
MGNTEQKQTEESTEPTEPAEPQEQEQEEQQAPPPEEEAQPAEPEAKEEGAPEEEPPPESEEAKAAAEEKGRRSGGWKRKIERQERQIEVLTAQLANQRPSQQPPAAEEKSKDPADQVRHFVREEAKALLKEERDAEQRARAQAEFQKRTQEVRAAHPDFDEALDDVSHVPVPQAIQQALLTSEQGPAIMYSLAKNQAELARICALPPFEAAREIGRLEAKASSTPTPKAPTKSASRPPAPPTSVGGPKSTTRSLDDLPLADYKRAYRSGRR